MKVEGKNAVLEVLKAGRTVDKLLLQKGAEGALGRIFAMAREQGVRVQFADAKALARESETGRHQGAIAYVSDYAYADFAELLAPKAGPRLVIVCDGVEDVHNLGSIIRVAECAGADGVVIPAQKSASVTEAVVRISAGAANHVMVAKVPSLSGAIERLKECGYWRYALEADGQSIYSADLSGKVGLVIGGEDSGVRRLTRERCDGVLSLPLLGKVNSLNASVALGIAAYEVVRCRIKN